MTWRVRAGIRWATSLTSALRPSWYLEIWDQCFALGVGLSMTGRQGGSYVDLVKREKEDMSLMPTSSVGALS